MEDDFGSNKKELKVKDMVEFRAETKPLVDLYSAFENKKIQVIVCNGSAGTGKTLNPIYLALKMVLEPSFNTIDKLVIMRSCVPVREIGFEKGYTNDKEAPYKRPYIDVCKKIFTDKNGEKIKNAFHILEKTDKIEFMSTTYIQGCDIENAIIFVDEAENLNSKELYSAITRAGKNSRVVFSGDLAQDCLGFSNPHDVSGFSRFIEIMSRHYPENNRKIIDFELADSCLRSNIVKNYIKAENDFKNTEKFKNNKAS